MRTISWRAACKDVEPRKTRMATPVSFSRWLRRLLPIAPSVGQVLVSAQPRCMNDGVKLFANVFALDGFNELHLRVQRIERLNAPLQDSHPALLRATRAKLQQVVHRVGHHLS